MELTEFMRLLHIFSNLLTEELSCRKLQPVAEGADEKAHKDSN